MNEDKIATDFQMRNIIMNDDCDNLYNIESNFNEKNEKIMAQ